MAFSLTDLIVNPRSMIKNILTILVGTARFIKFQITFQLLAFDILTLK